ncbi:hypothetical protein LCGC14_0295170 [marine sediment metagenome]|uniref:Uncharacterized protein n=1 Tax=marine sediment metagenome TaxID=412755 RepID=A0A0F9TX51_9ZZZZ
MTADVDHQLEDIAADVRELKEWTVRHEKLHTSDQDLLAAIINTLAEHQTNHHGRLTFIKQSGVITALLATIGGIAELLRRLFLS